MQLPTGRDRCLQVSAKDESSVVVGPCVGAKREQWKVQGATIRSAFGGCIDNSPTKPANPQYGPLVVAPCGESECGGKDHQWKLNPATKQLVSAVPGLGEQICVEAQVTHIWTANMDCNPTLWPGSPRIAVQLS